MVGAHACDDMPEMAGARRDACEAIAAWERRQADAALDAAGALAPAACRATAAIMGAVAARARCGAPSCDLAALALGIGQAIAASRRGEAMREGGGAGSSVSDASLTCLEDGLAFSALAAHLRSAHGLTPDQYRNRWDLPSDYPMLAPAEARRRRQAALDAGLGRRPRGDGR